MSKWVLRLVGVLILGALAILFYDVWFRPSVPETLQDEISLQVGDQRPPRNDSEQGNSPNNGVEIPDVPDIELTSLEDQNEPAVLSNPQSSSPQPQPSEKTVTEQKASSEPEQIVAQSNIGSGASWVQVGSFSDNDNAQKMVAQMRQQHWPTDTEVANVNGKSYHRVFVGPLAVSDVPAYLDKLQEMGINAREVTR